MDPVIFAGTPDSIAQARALVAGYFDGEARDNATLVLSEVASNALKYGRGPYQVEIHLGATFTRVLVESSDNPPVSLRAHDASSTREGGRGLALVEAYADDWGTMTSPAGNMVVWFDIACACVTLAA